MISAAASLSSCCAVTALFMHSSLEEGFLCQYSLAGRGGIGCVSSLGESRPMPRPDLRGTALLRS